MAIQGWQGNALVLIKLVALLRSINAERIAAPIPFTWSTKTYGPEGPWHAIQVYLGTPRQAVDVFPHESSYTIPLGSTFCQQDLTQNDCHAIPPAMYDVSASSTADVLQTGGQFTYTQGFGISYAFSTILDSFNVNNDPTGAVDDSGLVIYDLAYHTYPSGLEVPFTLGGLSLGAPNFNNTITTDDEVIQVDANIPTSYLYQQGVIPSASFGLHIGSVAMGIPGSLWFGGYDRSRVLGPVLSKPVVAFATPYFMAELVDISISTGRGQSPFPTSKRTGILVQGNSSIDGSLSMAVELYSPYLLLPRSVCDSMVQDLPVTYDSGLGLYLWNTNDPRYTTILSSASYVSFRFDASPDPVVINIPFQLLNLTLEAPIVKTPTQYFPCSPSDLQTYVLGRAFFQAAFIGANWAPGAQSAYWFMGQARGPNTPHVLTVIAIADTATNISSDDGSTWESTWYDHWNTYSAKSINGTKSPDAHSSRSKRIAFIVVCSISAPFVILGIALCILDILDRSSEWNGGCDITCFCSF